MDVVDSEILADDEFMGVFEKEVIVGVQKFNEKIKNMKNNKN